MNVAMDDHSLLKEFAQNQSQDAFRELVDRHLRMVYGAAHRIVRDVHLAEEVAQNVFTLLAKKAAGIVPPQVVAGWLYNSTRHLAMHCVRSEQRRREREETAATMHLNHFEPDAAWVMDHLEEALAELESFERDALVLRFLEDRNFRDVGQELGVSEDAARMRVNRAVDSIRSVFQRRGVSISTIGFAATVAAASAAPPAGLAVSVASAGLAATFSTTATQGVLMHWLTSKTTAVVAAAALAGGTTYVAQSGETARLQQTVAGLQQQQQAAQDDLETIQATNQSLQAALKRMESNLQNENRLRLEAVALRQSEARLRQEVGELKNEVVAAKDSLQEMQAKEAARKIQEDYFKMRIDRVNLIKRASIPVRFYYRDNNRFPATLSEITAYSPNLSEFAEIVEMVPGAERIPENHPDRILLREKAPRQRPDGTWERVYSLVDGSTWPIVQDSSDYSNFEKERGYR